MTYMTGPEAIRREKAEGKDPYQVTRDLFDRRHALYDHELIFLRQRLWYERWKVADRTWHEQALLECRDIPLKQRPIRYGPSGRAILPVD